LDPAFNLQDPGESETRKHLSVIIDQFCEPKVVDAGDGNQPQAVKATFDANALQEQGSRFYGMAVLAAVRMQFSRKPPAADSDDEQENESGGDTEDQGKGQVEDGGGSEGVVQIDTRSGSGDVDLEEVLNSEGDPLAPGTKRKKQSTAPPSIV
jgi:hypothetical protein